MANRTLHQAISALRNSAKAQMLTLIGVLSQAFKTWRGSKKLQILTLIGITLAAGLAFQVAEAQPSFCNSCHEMNFHYTSWQNSTHGSVSNCLDCHLEPGLNGQIDVKIRGIQELIAHFTGNFQLPIRASADVKNVQCLTCHQDAANITDRNVDLRHGVHLEAGVQCVDCHANIVHNEPGQPKVMPLTQCESCHQKHSQFPMTDAHATLKCSTCHVNGIYAKIDATCETCHSAPVDHVYSISTNCAACHTLQGWGQAVGNHTNLPLTEKHSNLACVQCHPNDVYRQVSNLCESCHVRPAEHFNTTYSCDSCHTPVGWTPAKYDHSFYPLENGHQTVQCAQCHVDHGYVGTPKKCELCHTAPNDHVYGIDTRCEACHVTEGWKPATASHSGFPLAERHASLQCSQCHTNTNYSMTPKTCESCHTLPEGHFNTQRFNTTVGCSSCHAASGWTPASFDHSFYSLTGGHASANCSGCHVGGQYSGTPQSCSSCHEAPQNHPISNNNNCVQCHETGAWLPTSYDHSGFALTGAHGSVACSSCHSSGVYSGLSTSCESCHSPPANHPVKNAGSCSSCHSKSGWQPARYSHSGFVLTGAHTSLSCSSCHSGGVYSGLSTSCASCHQTPSTHAGLGTNCFSCHSGNTFSPSIYVHQQVGPHVPSGDRRLSCSSCHRPNYSAASCTGSGCHSSTPRG